MKKTLIVGLLSSAAVLAQDNEIRAKAAGERAVAAAREVERTRDLLYQLTGQPIVGVRVGNVDPIQGRPFSATEVNSSVQTLANGARIENRTTSKLYRDVDGRTRIETDNGSITIVDPVEGYRATLNPQTKAATKGGARPVALAPGAVAVTPYRVDSILPQGAGKEVREGLGVQSINGATATGERVTITIPMGQIGNDRDLMVVTERWYSEDLRMLVKSVNSDPRYGETTYELTNITLANPDPSLFQIPADYRVVEGGGRGGGRGRGPATAPPGAGTVPPGGVRGGRGQ